MKTLHHFSRQYRIWRNKQKQFFSLKKLTPLMLAILLSKEGMAQDKKLNDFLPNNEFLTFQHRFLSFNRLYHVDIDSDGDLDFIFNNIADDFSSFYIKNNGFDGLSNYTYDTFIKDSSNLYKLMGLENSSYNNSIYITSFFFDFDHDGDVDLLNREHNFIDKKLKFYKNNLNGNKPIFDTIPSLVLDNYNFTNVIDVTGDGLEDLVFVDYIDSNHISFYPNIGNQNIPDFGNEVMIPLNFDLGKYSIDLKDMDGDHKIDIALISSGTYYNPAEVAFLKCISQNPLLFDTSKTLFYTKEQFERIKTYEEFVFVDLLDLDLDGDIDIRYFEGQQGSYGSIKLKLFTFLENLNTKSLNQISGTVNIDWDKNGDVDDYEEIYEYIYSPCGYRCQNLNFNLNPINYWKNKNLNFETPDTIIKTQINNIVTCDYGSIFFAMSNPSFFKGFANSGNLKIYPDSLEGFTIVPPYYEFNFAADTNYFIDSIIFNFQPINDEKNLAINMSGFANRPGFDVYQNIVYQNFSILLDSGVIAYTPDTLYTFIDANPMPTTSLNGTYYWNIDGIDKFNTRYIDVHLQLSVDAELGKYTTSTIQFLSNIGPDRVPANNYDTLKQLITSSYDPNDKIVTPIPNTQGIIELTDQPFEYTVRFQNTGNDTAFTVVITDTLEKDFDLGSLKLLAASDPFVFDMKSGNVATWRFNSINLPPLSTNEQGSNGFVKYSIKPLEGKGIGSEFTNTANIYFDFNEPIITNQTRNIFGVINGIQLHDNQPEIKIKAYPNPVHDKLLIEINNPKNEDMIFSVYDINGTELFSKTINSNFFHFSTQDYAPAMYLYTIESASGFGKGKFVKE